MSVKIGQASYGESGIANQTPGNQTGRELNFAKWYNGYWHTVLRFKNPDQAERAAKVCEAAVNNKNIGYCQTHRNTLYKAAKARNWDLAKISEAVETDCSALMFCCAVAAGATALEAFYIRNNNSCSTHCMASDWPSTGAFEKLTDARYTRSDAYLRRGDILVSSGHTVMVLEDGPKAKEDDEVVEKSKIIINGKEHQVERILKDGTNYIKIRDLATALNLDVSSKGNIAVLSTKK